MVKFPKLTKAKVVLATAATLALGTVGGVGYLQTLAKPEKYMEYQIDKHQTDIVNIESKIWYTIEFQHQAVVLGLGGMWERVQSPGLNFRIPFLEKAYDVHMTRVFEIQRGFRTAKAGVETKYEDDAKYETEARMVTGDEGELSVKYVTQYIKMNASAFLFNVDKPHETVAEVTESALREVIATNEYSKVMTTGKEEISEKATEIAQKVLDEYKTGIKIIAIRLKQVTPPTPNVQLAFDGINNAVQQAERLIQEGKQEYEQETREAQGTAQKNIQNAKGDASEMVNTAEGRVARFNSAYEEFKLAPEANMYRLHQQAIRDLLKGSDVKIVDKDLASGTLNHIFLEKGVKK